MSARLKRNKRLATFVLVTLGVGGCAAPALTPPAPVFARDVRPLFERRCIRCHGQDEDFQGGLDLRNLCTIRVGGRSGPAVVAGEPEDSLLFQMIVTDEMPAEGKKLTLRERDRVRHWIASGAK